MTIDDKIVTGLLAAGFTLAQTEKMVGPLSDGASFLTAANGKPLSEDYFNFARKIDNIAAALRVTPEAVRHGALLSPTLVIRNADTLAQNVDGTTQRLNIDRAQYVDRLLRYAPSLLGYTPDTVERNVRSGAAFTGMRIDDYIARALKHPSLFALDENTLRMNAEGYRKRLGLTQKEYQRAVRTESTLAYRKAESAEKTMAEIAAVLGISPKALTAIIVQQNQQQLMTRSADTIRGILDGDKDAGYRGVVELLNVPRRFFIQSALKRVSVLAQSARRTNYNLRKQADYLDVEPEPYIRAALKRAPQLMTLRPDNIFVNTVATAAKLGINYKTYAAAVALQAPQLLYQSADTIDARMTKSAAAIGIDKKEYVAMALRQPTLFYRDPEGIAKNARLMEMFHEKGILEGHARDFFVKKPDVLCLATDNFHLRYLFARLSGLEGAKGYGVLRMPRHEVETRLARLFGHDPEQRIVTRPIVKGLDVPEEDKKHRAFVGLIRRGIIRSFTYQPE